MDMTLSIHECLIGIEKRAERADEQKLTETFVDAAPLLASVGVFDHQIIFGRRGTGKTHLLKYINDQFDGRGDISLYIDLRLVGSNNSIYSDQEKSHAQRATPLLLDVLLALHENLLRVAMQLAVSHDLSSTAPKLDVFADAISVVEVVGITEKIGEDSTARTSKVGADLKLGFEHSQPSGSSNLIVVPITHFLQRIQLSVQDQNIIT